VIAPAAWFNHVPAGDRIAVRRSGSDLTQVVWDVDPLAHTIAVYRSTAPDQPDVSLRVNLPTLNPQRLGLLSVAEVFVSLRSGSAFIIHPSSFILRLVLSHFDDSGAARMVDVGQKPVTERMARASARVRMLPETLALVRDGRLNRKGDVLQVARLAGIMAAKRTGELIPLCHPLPLDSVSIEFAFPADMTSAGPGDPRTTLAVLAIEATVRTTARTGVEMEALTAVTVAALTVYDMCKSVDRGMVIEQIQLEEKSGGKSGDFLRAARIGG
jgi:cyclic pyranopterin phosphate synthase